MEKIYPSFDAAKAYKDEQYPDSTLIVDGKVWDILIFPALEKDFPKYFVMFQDKFPFVQDSDALSYSSNGQFVVKAIAFDGFKIARGPVV